MAWAGTRTHLSLFLAVAIAGAGSAEAGTIQASPYGTTASGQPVTLYTLHDDHGITVRVTTYGAILTAIDTPDRAGHAADIVLGLPDLHAYEAINGTTHFGALIGRYANRIGHARFSLDGHSYTLTANDHGNALHGGSPGFDRVVWQATVKPPAGDAVGVTLRYTSPDGDQGFPGTLRMQVTYTLDHDALRIDYAATTNKDTVLNITNHSYFNLAGNGSGSVERQRLLIDADRYTPTDSVQLPTGAIASVAGTPLDFRAMTAIGARLRDPSPQLVAARGYDNNWVLNKSAGPGPQFAACARDPGSGRIVELFTTEPGLQVYTANSLDGSVVGSSGGTYRMGDAFTLETQHFPDSPNHPGFPTTELKPGQTFRSTTLYRFAADRAGRQDPAQTAQNCAR